MKIFAKRTRKFLDAEEAEKLRKEEGEAKAREGEKAVKDLLKRDPSTLNAKERRMLKRYSERAGERSEEKSSIEENGNKTDAESNQTGSQPTVEPDHEHVEGNDEHIADATGVKEDEDDKPCMEANETMVDHIGDVDIASQEPRPESNDLDEEQVKKLLEGLNSKQRRTLMRKLDREGEAVLEEVRKEALRLLEESKAQIPLAATTTETEHQQSQSKDPSTSGKKRKKDWSDLSPEERTRRETQHRKQQEAAERREKQGDDHGSGKHRHPLNSERRRANRRKPRWERNRQANSEHNTSGFQVRKNQQSMNSH